MSRKITMLFVGGAIAIAAVMPLSAQASAEDVSVLVQQQWVPATAAEVQEARGGAWVDLTPVEKRAVIKRIIKRFKCKRQGTGC